MKLRELYRIEQEYQASGHYYLTGRTAPSEDLKRFIVFPDPFLSRGEWLIIEKPYGVYRPPLSRNKATGYHYLQYLYQLIDSGSEHQ